MKGTILYPLNILKFTEPDIYTTAVEKYNSREWLLAEEIAPLHCLWNDALHLTAVEPIEIKKALQEAGNDVEFEFYKIDPFSLNHSDTTVYLCNEPKGAPKEFIAYDPAGLQQYSHMPDATKQYYTDMISNKKQPLLFHLVPHILYKGSIDISHAEIIKV